MRRTSEVPNGNNQRTSPSIASCLRPIFLFPFLSFFPFFLPGYFAAENIADKQRCCNTSRWEHGGERVYAPRRDRQAEV